MPRITSLPVESLRNIDDVEYLGSVTFKPMKENFQFLDPLILEMIVHHGFLGARRYATLFPRGDVSMDSLDDKVYRKELRIITEANNLFVTDYVYNSKNHVVKGKLYYDKKNPTFLDALKK